LLSFYRVTAFDGLPEYRGPGLDRDCAALTSAEVPVVLSPRAAAEVEATFACAPTLTVLPASRTGDRSAQGGEAP
jgi:hypothetical protein